MKKLVSLFLIMTGFAKGQITVPSVCFNYLSNITTVTTGINPYSIANSDFNVDGQQDLAVANYTSNNVSVLTGIGGGVFTPPVNFPAGTNPCSIKKADLNNDGKMDLITANKGSNNISILFGTAPGSFSTAVNYPVGTAPNCVFVADFNNDGNKDIVTANYNSNNISVLLGSSTGTFSAASNYNVGTNPHSVISADFNTDGNLDLAVTNINSNNVYVFLGNGTGSFPSSSIFVNAFGLSFSGPIVSSDINGDGKLDIITTNGSWNSGISVFSGNGSGGFAFASSLAVSGNARDLILNDFNNDGKADLATLNYDSSVGILLGNGSGAYTLNGYYNSGPNPQSFTATDFNGDSQLDFAITNTNTNKISIVFGVGDGSFLTSMCYNPDYGSFQGICSGDFNGDGKLDIATAEDAGDKVAVHLGNGSGLFAPAISHMWTMCSGDLVTADFNNDGKLDIAGCGYTSSTNTVTLLLGNGTGSFSINFFGTGMGNDPVALTTADFNNDGKKDIATANFSGNSISVFLGTGTGSLSNATNYVAGSGPRSIKSADFNSDGNIDLVVVSGNSANVFFGNGNGTFMPYAFYAVGTNPYRVVTGDFNSDGNVDIATANYGANNITVLSGSSTGTFVSLGNYSLNSTTGLQALHTDDFNGDGKLDLIAGSYNSGGKVHILLGHGTGFFDPAINYELGYGATAITSGDFNADGRKDIALVDAEITKVFMNGFAPSISVSGPSITCSGNPVTLAAAGSNFYYWSTGATSSSVSVAPTVNTTYSVTGSNLAGCGATVTKSISVNPNPTITVNNGTICYGDSYTITPGGAVSYTFSGGSAVVTPTATAAFTVSGTNTLGCIGMSVCNVTVNPLPVISVNDATICTGQSYTISPFGASTYTYSGGNSVVSPTTSTSYSVTGTNAFGCVSPAAAVCNVSTSATPAPTITVNSGIICPGNSFTIAPGGANTYTYSSGSAIVSPTTNTSYSITGTDVFGCVSSLPAISSVTVNTFSISVNSGTLCNGNTFTINPSGASTYTVSGGNFVVSPTVNTTYSITGTSASGCLSANTAISTVTVNPSPTVTVASGSVCSGGGFMLSPCCAGSYTYSSGSAWVTPSVSSVYTVTGFNGFGCTSSATSTITVYPTVTLTIPNGTICSGSSFTITPSGATSYTYSSGSPVVTPTSNTNYFISGDNGTGCLGYASCSVTVNQTPTVTAYTTNSIICIGQTATLVANGANFYSWSSGGNSSIEVVSPTVTVTYTVNGTYLSGGCSGTAVITQSVSACTGLDYLNGLTAGIIIYPNPFDSKLMVVIPEASPIQVFDALGSLIYFVNAESGSTVIDLSQIASGIYFIKTGNVIKKIIKEY